MGSKSCDIFYKFKLIPDPGHDEGLVDYKMKDSVEEQHSETQEELCYGPKHLIDAVIENDITKVKCQLNSGVSPNIEYEEKVPLCIAAGRGHNAIVKLLIDEGVRLDCQDPCDKMWRKHAIHIASSQGQIPVVETLLSHGVSINVGDKEMRTPLHWAATKGQLEMVKYLVDKKASVTALQTDGYTVLHCATCLGHREICEYLISSGANVNQADRDGWTVLHCGVCYNHVDLVDMFLEKGVILDNLTKHGETALHIAVQGECKMEMVKKLIKHGTNLENLTIYGNTPLFDSIWHTQFEVSQYLIDLGAKVNIMNNSGLTPLYLATLRGHEDFINLLLNAGVNIHKEIWLRYGLMPITGPCCKENFEWMKTLIRHPTMLQHSCRIVIRNHLRKPVSVHVSQLDLPVTLRNKIIATGCRT